jgi:glycerol-3-phosphate dehydrogenase
VDVNPAVTPTTRQEALARLRPETFDVLILGGGINGAGLARDLALRSKIGKVPLRIALVEQNHFGSGTSGKNSHLIHGGLRYLKQLQIGLVRESLHERAVLLRIAPHLVDPLPFLMPLTGFGHEIYYNLGLTLYDWLSGNGALPHHRRVPLDEIRRMEPELGVPAMTAAAEYHDAEVRSARVVLENIFEAISNGAVCSNYVRAESHTRESGGTWRLSLRNTFSNDTFETRARVLVDATGSWAHDPAPRLVRGSHIVFPRLNTSDRAIAYFLDSGRIVFFIPWGERKDRTLIGTTDVDHAGSPDEVHISDEELTYLRSVAATVFPESERYTPLASFSSLRPLLASSGSATGATREHRIFHDAQGVLRITGGKFTTYRAMSQEAANLVTAEVAPALRKLQPTADHALNGNTPSAINALLSEAPGIAARYSVATSEIIMLIKQYGLLTSSVLDYISDAPSNPLSRIDAARLTYAVRHEMALHTRDFLEVSTTLGLEGNAPLLSPDSGLLTPDSCSRLPTPDS